MSRSIEEKNKLSKNIKEAVSVLCEQLEKSYPGIKNKFYYKKGKKHVFSKKIEICVCIELLLCEKFNN